MMNRKRKAVFIIVILLYDCVFVNLKYDDGIPYSPFLPKYFQTLASQDIGRHIDNMCMLSGTCRLNYREKHSLPVCYCDHACREYNDCCFDSSFIDTPLIKNGLQNNNNFISCEDKLFNNKHFGVLMVTKCSSSYGIPDVSEKCSSAQFKHPVSGDDGTIYKNVYCAYCHNVSRYTAWHFEYNDGNDNCSLKSIEKVNVTISAKMKYIIENKCRYYFLPPSDWTYRTCFRSDETTHALCSKFQNPVKINDKLYRNVFCNNESFEIEDAFCLKNQIAFNYDLKGYNDLMLTRIFNIRPVLEIHGQRKECENNFYYDTTKEACIPNRCTEKPANTCNSETIRNFAWGKEIQFVSDDIVDRAFIMRLSNFIFLSLPVECYDIIIGFVRGYYKCGRALNHQVKHCCLGYLVLEFKNRAEMIPETTSKFLTDAKKMKWMYQERTTKMTITAYDLYENSTMNWTCKTTGSPTETVSQFGTALSLGMFYFTHTNRTKLSNEVPKRVEGVVVTVSRTDRLRPEFRLEKWDFQYTTDNTSETDVTSLNMERLNIFTVGTILTYITLGISCLSLMITLIVYTKLGLFLSQPGIISKRMMGNMLVAQLLFIGGAGASDVTVICTVIGIVSHFLWLCSFTWISAFLFSILEMMSLLRTYPGALTTERRISNVYYCFGYLLPFIVVLLCSLLDIFTEIDIGYNHGKVCFPTGFPANLFSFTLPVLLSLCINIVVLVLTSISITRYNNTTQLLHSVRKMRSFIPTYIRLNILCACPWILGIIADMVESDILRYIYILLAGSHGTFVGLSFLLATSVRRRIRCNSKIRTKDVEFTVRR